MQIEREREMRMQDNAFDYMKDQQKVLVVEVYLFETFKAVDKEVYRTLFGGEGKIVNGSMVEISNEQLKRIETDPRYEIHYVDMKKEEYNVKESYNVASNGESNDLYNNYNGISDDLLNMMEDIKKDVNYDETTLKK